jgi:pimeloyl-ACP methyl ester carboxylesterase
VRDLHTRVVPGGHWIMTEQPRVLADAVDEFIGRLDR